MWDLPVLLFLLGMAVSLALKLMNKQRSNQKINAFLASFHGPAYFPVIGTAHILAGITRRNLIRTLKRQLDLFPGSLSHWIFGNPYFISSDPSIFRAVLRSPQNINKLPDYKHFKTFAHGIFSQTGQTWRDTRKMINPSFQTKVIESFDDNFSYHTETYLKILQQHSEKGSTFDLFVLIHTCTIDLVCDNMLGCRMDFQKKGLTHFATNMRESSQTLIERMFNFFLWSDLIFSFLGKRKEVDQMVTPIRAICREIVKQQWRKRLDSKTDHPNGSAQARIFMEILLDNIESGAITEDQAVEESVEMFISATITTATVMSWVLKTLAMRPEIQQRAYREIVETADGLEVTMNDLSKLVYLEMVIKEALRHFTIPFIGRSIDEDLKVDDKTTIPAGMNVLLMMFTLHHDPEYWERPGEFYPEHFLPANELRRPKGVFFPLSSGPRMCPGNKYAMLSMKYLLANTLLQYEFETDEKPSKDIREDDYRWVFALYPASGFFVKVKERNSKITTSERTNSDSCKKVFSGHYLSEERTPKYRI